MVRDLVSVNFVHHWLRGYDEPVVNFDKLPVYGDGRNISDCLCVDDHCATPRRVLEASVSGQTYNIGGDVEMADIDLVESICASLDELVEGATPGQPRKLTAFVEDRPGHDRRYAINAPKISCELERQPPEAFATALREAVEWCLANGICARHVQSVEYHQALDAIYAQGMEGA